MGRSCESERQAPRVSRAGRQHRICSSSENTPSSLRAQMSGPFTTPRPDTSLPSRCPKPGERPLPAALAAADLADRGYGRQRTGDGWRSAKSSRSGVLIWGPDSGPDIGAKRVKPDSWVSLWWPSFWARKMTPESVPQKWTGGPCHLRAWQH